MLYVTCYILLLYVTYYILHVTYYILRVTCDVLQITCYYYVTYYILHVTCYCYLLHITHYMSDITCYILHVTCDVLHITYADRTGSERERSDEYQELYRADKMNQTSKTIKTTPQALLFVSMRKL